jgi:ABC-type Mn2+/Zn2+ transport system permease subunit
MQVISQLAGAWFIGAAGGLIGVYVGMRSEGTVRQALIRGALLGALAGVVLSLELIREVIRSTSSSGMVLVPFPPLTNGVAGGLIAVILREWNIGRSADDGG